MLVQVVHAQLYNICELVGWAAHNVLSYWSNIAFPRVFFLSSAYVLLSLANIHVYSDFPITLLKPFEIIIAAII